MKIPVVLFLLLVLCSSVWAQPPRPKISKLPSKLEKETNFLNPEFLVYSLHSSNAKNVPLVIYLHGAGGVGEDINRIKGQPMGVCRGIEHSKGQTTRVPVSADPADAGGFVI